MTATPLFISDEATLLAALRLSRATAADTLAAFEGAVRRVRLGFYDRLGADRVASLVSLTPEDPPTTNEGILRSKAQECEVLWTRMLLIRELPQQTIDGNARKVWNEEPLTRDAAKFDIEDEVRRLQTEIDGYLADLAAGEDTPTAKAVSIGPDAETCPPLAVGRSVFAFPRRRCCGG